MRDWDVQRTRNSVLSGLSLFGCEQKNFWNVKFKVVTVAYLRFFGPIYCVWGFVSQNVESLQWTRRNILSSCFSRGNFWGCLPIFHILELFSWSLSSLLDFSLKFSNCITVRVFETRKSSINLFTVVSPTSTSKFQLQNICQNIFGSFFLRK